MSLSLILVPTLGLKIIQLNTRTGHTMIEQTMEQRASESSRTNERYGTQQVA